MKSAILIVPSERLAAENEWLRTTFKTDGDNITVPLSSDGSEPATHYGCDWPCITDAHYTQIYNRLQNRNGCKCFNSNTWEFDAAIASVGLMRVQSEMPI